MNEKQGKKRSAKDIEAIAEQAERGEDISEHFTGQYVAKQRINVDFPLTLLKAIDAECRRIGITRQAWIKMACDARLRQTQTTLTDPVA